VDDDGPPTAGTSTGSYRDVPERENPGSRDGSWQGASEGDQRIVRDVSNYLKYPGILLQHPGRERTQ